MSENVEAFDIIITGKVQGIYFRASMKSVAEANSLVGWVRNLDDGRVEAVVQGKGSDIEKILQWCKVGPRNAIVSDVAVKRLKVETRLRNFSIVF